MAGFTSFIGYTILLSCLKDVMVNIYIDFLRELVSTKKYILFLGFKNVDKWWSCRKSTSVSFIVLVRYISLTYYNNLIIKFCISHHPIVYQPLPPLQISIFKCEYFWNFFLCFWGVGWGEVDTYGALVYWFFSRHTHHRNLFTKSSRKDTSKRLDLLSEHYFTAMVYISLDTSTQALSPFRTSILSTVIRSWLHLSQCSFSTPFFDSSSFFLQYNFHKNLMILLCSTYQHHVLGRDRP